MSLLPIIYTSVAIFAALMVIVITISYISYKVKVNENDFPTAEKAAQPKVTVPNVNNNRQVYNNQKAVVNNRPAISPYPVAAVPVQKAPRIHKQEVPFYPPYEFPKTPQYRESSSRPNISPPVYEPQKPVRSADYMSNHTFKPETNVRKIESNKPRIEVLNLANSEFQTAKPHRSRTKIDNSPNLNFFNFYTNADEGNLNHIQTNSI